MTTFVLGLICDLLCFEKGDTVAIFVVVQSLPLRLNFYTNHRWTSKEMVMYIISQRGTFLRSCTELYLLYCVSPDQSDFALRCSLGVDVRYLAPVGTPDIARVKAGLTCSLHMSGHIR